MAEVSMPNGSDKAANAREEALKYRVNDIPKRQEDHERRTPIVQGKVTRHKKNIFQRLVGRFIEEDAPTIRDYIVNDILIPKSKDLIYAIGDGLLGRSLYGGGQRPRNVTNYGTSSYTSYSSRYSYGDVPRYETRPINSSGVSRVRKPPRVMDDIILDSREEANAILEEMLDIYRTYGAARVADLYDLIGSTSEYTDLYYGWLKGINGLETAYTDRVRDGWKLYLPPIRPIE